jgi:hypothetical protein
LAAEEIESGAEFGVEFLLVYYWGRWWWEEEEWKGKSVEIAFGEVRL